jgi:hypothetical protein
MAPLRNPALAGPVQFDTGIYGAPPLTYPRLLSQYVIYNTPDPAYVTGRINVSPFANLGGGTPWPFLNTNVPLNGHVCLPRGRGPVECRVDPTDLRSIALVFDRRAAGTVYVGDLQCSN